MLNAKGVFDVLIAVDDSKPFGLSCKTSGERKGNAQLLMEVELPLLLQH